MLLGSWGTILLMLASLEASFIVVILILPIKLVTTYIKLLASMLLSAQCAYKILLLL
jgi:hypothetical protein